MTRRYSAAEHSAPQAELLVSQGRLDEARGHYRALIAQTHVIDYEYDEWLRALARLERATEQFDRAGLIALYLHDFDAAEAALAPLVRGRLADARKQWKVAAQAYEVAELPVHAAVAYERDGARGEAGARWQQVTQSPNLAGRPYERALAHFNMGMALAAAEPGSPAARRALIESQQRLEQVADDFEGRGELERAFDCYQILLKLGKDSGQYENLAEGYLNCIRVLKADHLKFYVLQYYEDFIALSSERGEHHAAALLYQEAAQYAARAGLPYDRRYHALAAESWGRAADAALAAALPVQLVENALLAGIAQASAVGDFPNVRATFQRLATLELGPRSQARYQAVAARLAKASRDPAPAPGFPDYLRQQHAYAEIWFADLLEQEMAGDAYLVATSIIGDLRFPNGIRRRALILALTSRDPEGADPAVALERRERECGLLGELQAYAALRPLEARFADPEPRVRAAAVRALRFLYFKRSFGLVRQALADPQPTVREAARAAIASLHFPHALGPLGALVREDHGAEVRLAAVDAIGKIQSIEAAEFLVQVIREHGQAAGESTLTAAAVRALRGIDNADVRPIIRQHLDVEAHPFVRGALSQALGATPSPGR